MCISCTELPLFYNCLVHDKRSWGQCQLEYDALTSSVSILMIFIVYSFVWSLICNNVSKVDQIWSITPGVYCIHYFYLNYVKDTLRGRHGFHERLCLITVLVVIWGIRLTYNFWRRGGYGNLIFHEEDYRWPILKKMMSPPVWLLFNFTFIATYQNILLWLLTLPAYIVMQSKLHHIHIIDIILAFFFLLLLFMETIADQQHYGFQEYKKTLTPEQRKKHHRKDIRDGFLQSGLFLYSRHPNYFAEQAMWVVIFLFTVHGFYINYSCIGCVLLILLFQGSMAFSESITLSKYPAYETYQITTSQCIPMSKPFRQPKSYKAK